MFKSYQKRNLIMKNGMIYEVDKANRLEIIMHEFSLNSSKITNKVKLVSKSVLKLAVAR
jgi:hypothetical protein